jgi:iron complex outermembrane recepter protein
MQNVSGDRTMTCMGFGAVHRSAMFVLAASTALASPAFAQGSSPARNVEPTSDALPEIIVTAQKRSENLQNVPVSIVAITAQDALSRGMTGTDGLTALVPGLVMTNPVNVGNPYLRGVGSSLFDPSSEQSVAMYVDGVYIAAPQSNIFSFNNLQQIEVLRGPQGTLFGRNATGGVINIITKSPSATPSADLSIGYGNYNTFTASGYVTGGLTRGVSADFAGLYENQKDGFGRNLTTRSQTFQQARGNYSLRTKVLIEPSPSTTIVLAGDFSHSVSTNAYQKPQGVISPIDGSSYPGPYNTVADLDNRNEVDTGGASLRIEQQIGKVRIMNLVAYRETTVKYDLDNDVTALPVVNINLRPRTHNWSEELQISGPDAGWLKWMLGGYYYNAYGGYDAVIINGANALTDSQKAVSYAGFGQVTATVMSKTDITLGVRHTIEDQTYQLTAPAALTLKQSFNKTTFRAAINHRFSDNVSGYASFNTGFKSGGFNLLQPGNNFQPETLTAYEAGLKTELFDRRLRLNIGAFLYKNSNVQVLSSVLGGTVTSNAAAAEMKGFEVEFQAAPVEKLRISGGLSILNGKYTSYPNGVALNANGLRLPDAEQRGNKTLVTPPLSGNLSISYEFDLGNHGRLQPSATLAYNDGFFWQSDNRLRQPSYTLLNASALWTSADKNFDARLWVKNLTNAEYYVARLGVSGLGDVQERAQPRTFGITLGVHM